MGWSSGTDIAVEMAEAIKKHVKEPKIRMVLYQNLVETLESSDWDCQSEAAGIDPLLDEFLGLEEDDL